jgi:hypothetical protein
MIIAQVRLESKQIILTSGLTGDKLILVFDNKKSVKAFVKLVDNHCETIAVPAYIEGIGQNY